MSQEVMIGILTIVIGALLAGGLLLFRQVKREPFRAFVERISPDALQPLAVWAALQAYDAVEQVATAYGEMTNEEKQAQAAEWATAIYDFLATGRLSKDAATALLEAQIYNGTSAPAPKVEAVPPPETWPRSAGRSGGI